MNEFWETKFIEEQTTWGFKPCDSAIIANDFFLKNGVKNILIPGIGYGRNAKIFCDSGIEVTGIEISKTAINLANSKNALDIKIHLGSVTEMPFNNNKYDGIFCYALIHLLTNQERKKFIQDCYNQLNPGGYMFFTVASTKASMFGNGKKLSKNRFEIMKGLNVFFYDAESVNQEFNKYGLLEFSDIDEPIKHMEKEPPLNCILIKCKKN